MRTTLILLAAVLCLPVVYDFDLQGNALESAVTGQLTGKTMEGTYKTTTVADGSPVDEGTWKVSAQE